MPRRTVAGRIGAPTAAHWNAWNDGLEPANLCAVHVRRDNAGKLYLITGLCANDWARG